MSEGPKQLGSRCLDRNWLRFCVLMFNRKDIRIRDK